MKITKAETIRRIKATGKYYGIRIFSDGNIVGRKVGIKRVNKSKNHCGVKFYIGNINNKDFLLMYFPELHGGEEKK